MIDPGGTTGVAAAYVDLQPTLMDTLRGAWMQRAVEVPGRWDLQAEVIEKAWRRFYGKAVGTAGIRPENVHMVIEDFVLRRRLEGGATGNLTSVWVAAAVVARIGLRSDEVHWQQPGQAKGLATNERLQMWGLYTPGSEHTKDAWRHFAVRVNELIRERECQG